MSVQPSVKVYISRGVQTGDDIPPSQFSSLCEIQPLAVSSALASIHELEGAIQASTVSPDNIRSHLLGTLAYDSAYIQSKPSEHSELLPLLSKNKKYAAGLGMHRRSNPTGVQQRIASLPNPPPSQNMPLSDRNTRVVSMPESMISNSTTFYPGNSFFSTDHVQNHPSESPVQRQWQHSHNRNYLYDVPQTPSPPSSPDSVEIIGNEPHISGSFLRRTNFDDDGWITWASSPPRPIPALHGPLSLPYARCPSGAEGTVVEGDDLSHKIWGLGVGDQHPHNASTRIGKPDRHNVPPYVSFRQEYGLHSAQSIVEPRPNFQYPVALHGPKASVIDLSRPSTFFTSSEFEGIYKTPNPDRFGEGTLPRISLSSAASSGQLHSISSSDGVKPRYPSSIQYPGNNMWLPNNLDIMNDFTSNAHQIQSRDGKTLRSGVHDPRIDDATRTFRTNGQNSLNKSAPVFVPALDLAKDLSVHSNTRLPRRVELYQQRDDEINSPAASSTTWSPIFSHLADIQALTTPRHIQDSSMFPDPKIYSPVLDGDDYSAKLMAMMQQFKGQEYVNLAKRYPTRTVKQAGDFLAERKGSGDAGYVERKTMVDNNTSAPVNLDYRPSLSQQHPRSIPLARLIQRRLSSVQEEVGVGKQVSQPESDTKNRSVSHSSLDSTNLHPEIMTTPLQALQPAETVGERPDHGESSAIVRLPRKTAVHGSSRQPSRAEDSKRGNRYDNKGDKKNHSELSDAAVGKKGGNGAAKMKGKVSANEESV